MNAPHDLYLPFEHHFIAKSHLNKTPHVIIFTTEPADFNKPDGPDRSQVDVVACVNTDRGDPQGNRASQVAAFIAAAMNAYTQTPQGREHWSKTLSLLPLLATN